MDPPPETSTTTPPSSSHLPTITHIPHTPPSIATYLPLYKAFRLLSIRLAPEAFSSTYAREAAFTDETWYARLANPLANTFLATLENGEVVGSATVLGPLDFLPGEVAPTVNPWVGVGAGAGGEGGGKYGGKQEGDGAVGRPVHFRLNGVFTLPAVRRMGVGRAVVEDSVAWAMGAEGRKRGGGEVVVSVVVEGENEKARALYEKCGFVVTGKQLFEDGERGGREVIILEYRG